MTVDANLSMMWRENQLSRFSVKAVSFKIIIANLRTTNDEDSARWICNPKPALLVVQNSRRDGYKNKKKQNPAKCADITFISFCRGIKSTLSLSHQSDTFGNQMKGSECTNPGQSVDKLKDRIKRNFPEKIRSARLFQIRNHINELCTKLSYLPRGTRINAKTTAAAHWHRGMEKFSYKNQINHSDPN